MPEFDRINIEYEAIICLNGTLPESLSIIDYKKKIVIAADGAANKLFHAGITPSLIIGDGDSINQNKLPPSFDRNNLLIDLNQEKNDFEKILCYCIDNKIQTLMICGFHGGELEHTLNNISVFAKYANKLDMLIYDHGRLGIWVDNFLQLRTMPQEIISLIPMPIAILSTKNLRWSLDNELLAMGKREGARNQAIADFIEVHIHSGAIICFFDHKFK